MGEIRGEGEEVVLGEALVRDDIEGPGSCVRRGCDACEPVRGIGTIGVGRPFGTATIEPVC